MQMRTFLRQPKLLYDLWILLIITAQTSHKWKNKEVLPSNPYLLAEIVYLWDSLFNRWLQLTNILGDQFNIKFFSKIVAQQTLKSQTASSSVCQQVRSRTAWTLARDGLLLQPIIPTLRSYTSLKRSKRNPKKVKQTSCFSMRSSSPTRIAATHKSNLFFFWDKIILKLRKVLDETQP